MESDNNTESNQCCETFEHVARIPENFMSMVFYRYGKLAAKHAFKLLLVSLIILVGLSLGLIRTGTDFQDEDTVTSFVAKGTWLYDNYQQMQKEWPVNEDNFYGIHEFFVPEMYLLYIHTPGSSGNVFSTEGKAEILEFCQAMADATATHNGKTVTYDDVCSKSEAVSGPPACTLPYLCNLAITQTGSGLLEWYPLVRIESLLSVTEVKKANISALYDLLGEVITSSGDTNLLWFFNKNEEAYTWQYKVYKKLDELRKSFTNAEYYLFSYGQARYEDKQTFINDMPYLAAGFGMLLFYCCLVTFNLKLKGNRIPLTLSGLVTTLLSMSASFGIMIGAGVPFVTFSLVIPFVVIGIGIDAILVLSTEWANCAEISDPEERIGKTMERAFMGISLSHVTSLIAFLVGQISPFPAVDYLCGYMAVSIAIMWFGEGTLFLSFLALHGRWVASSDTSHGVNANQDTNDPSPVQIIQQNSDTSCVEACLMWILPKAATNKYFKVIIIMGLGIGVGLAIASVYAMPREEFYSIYYPDDSSIGEFYDARKDHYPFSYTISIILDKPLEYSNIETFNLIEAMYVDLGETGMYNKFAASWYSLFLQYEQNTGQNSFDGDEDGFVTRLQAWMDNVVVPSNPLYLYVLWLKQDVVIENNRIVRSRLYMQLTGRTEENLDQAKEGLEIVENTFDKYKDSLAPYTFSFVLAEMDRNVKLMGEVWKSVGIVAAVAVLVTLLFVPDLVVYVLVIFCFFSAMVGALGLMQAWGLTYALSTFVEIMLGFGLCVDYMAHIARGYMVSRGDTEEKKVKEVMGIIGVAMTNAVVTSILGVSMLSVAESYANRSFFIAMFLIYLCSYLFGVFLLPMLLSIVGGLFFRGSDGSKKSEKEHEYSNGGTKNATVNPAV